MGARLLVACSSCSRADPYALKHQGPTRRSLRDLAAEQSKSTMFAEVFDRLRIPGPFGGYDAQMRAWRADRNRADV